MSDAPKALNPWTPDTDPQNLIVLGKLAEELGEAQAIVARCIIQGIGESEPVTGKANRTQLEDELADVAACAGLAIRRFGLDDERMAARIDAKRDHLTRWAAMILPPVVETPAPVVTPAQAPTGELLVPAQAFMDAVALVTKAVGNAKADDGHVWGEIERELERLADVEPFGTPDPGPDMLTQAGAVAIGGKALAAAFLHQVPPPAVFADPAQLLEAFTAYAVQNLREKAQGMGVGGPMRVTAVEGPLSAAVRPESRNTGPLDGITGAYGPGGGDYAHPEGVVVPMRRPADPTDTSGPSWEKPSGVVDGPDYR